MANIKQQKKRDLTNNKKKLANNAFKSSLKTAMKNVELAVKEGKADEASKALQLAFAKLDKAVSKGFLHKNNCARHKSRLALLVNGLSK